MERIKTYFLLFFYCMLGSALMAQEQNRKKGNPPNVIMILADDMGWGDIGQGDQRIETPHLDQLAKQGIRLTSFYAGSSLCSPTRASLLTGRYPHSVGVPDLASPEVRGDVPILTLDHQAITIPEALKPLGYTSMLAGKWHLGFEPENWPRTHGFDEFQGSLIGTPRYYDVLGAYSNEDEVQPDKYFTDWITDRGIDFIKKQNAGPFFLYLAYNAPHYPLVAPSKLVNKYRKRFPQDGLYAIYAAMVERLDQGIGRVLKELEEQGLAENTLVIFCSDNGPSAELNSYGLPGAKISRGSLSGHKFSMFEGGIRVPFIARWPKHIPEGAIQADVATTMDIMPTILEAVGYQGEDIAFDGQSMLPIFKGKAPERKESLHWENMYNMAVRSGDWKLVHQFWEDRPRLYNILGDPSEQDDLYFQKPDLVKQLLEKHETWKMNRYPRPIPRQLTRPLNRIPTD